MKQCFKCAEVKPFSEFYKHKKMSDGYLGKCKECTKSDTRRNRLDNVEYYREYDRARGNRQTTQYLKEYREKYPKKYLAHTIIGNAVRDGLLFKQPCEDCGEIDGVHAHHDDYAKPLNVRWLCPVHHKKWHTENGEAANAT